jgi:prolyl oligopeptidase
MTALLPYPAAAASDTVDTIQGVRVADPYRWLEDGKAPKVVAWTHAQDDLARSELAKLPERDAIAKRMHELLYLDVLSTPRKRGKTTFWVRRHADKEKGIVYVKDAAGERVLLDPNGWTTDGSSSLGTYVPSWDGKKVAYTIKKNNSDEATLHVLDVKTGEQSKVDVIEGAKYAAPSWTPKSDGFYYEWLPTDPKIAAPDRPGFTEIRYHALGTDPAKDPTIRGKTGDPTKFVSKELAKDGSILLITIWNGWTSSDVYLQDLRTGAKVGTFVPLVTGKDHVYETTAFGGKIWVKTDEGASRGRIFEVDPKKLERAAWKEIVPEHPTASITGFAIAGGKLLVHYLDKASSRLEVKHLDGKPAYEVKLPGIVSVGAVEADPDDDEVYFSIESFTLPTEIHRMSAKTGKTEKQSSIKAPIDPSKYVVEQMTYPSKDGTKVTMFVVRGKDQPKSGKERVMIYGYGGFQSVENPFFASTIYPWLERGGIYVVTNLRGGAEYGEQWHKDGMLDKKQNVFDDYIGAAEALIKEGWTKPSRIAITGGSNGGLLVGAVMTQRPDLFGAVLCSVPLLDMVRYEKFGSGTTWASEYGHAEDPKMFPALYAYSPYHHVKEGVKYPPLLLLSADSDDRVDPMHARKFAALVQARSTGGPVLLRVERNSGHGGADMRKAEVQKNADRYAFALKHTSE